MKQILIVLALAFLLPAKANLHKYYVSIAEVAYNSETKKVELGIKVFFDDLQQAVRVEQNKSINDPLPKHEEAISTYIFNHFSITNGNGEDVNFSYLGMEDEMDAVWIYYESDEIGFTHEWTIKNTLFVDLFPKQINYVNFYPDKYDMTMVQGLLLNSQEKEGHIHFND